MNDRRRAQRHYLTGFALALALTLAAFALVRWPVLPRPMTLGAVALCALLQICVHFRWFLHLDASKSRREDLLLVLFAGLLIALMVGGTLWIMFDLNARMM